MSGDVLRPRFVAAIAVVNVLAVEVEHCLEQRARPLGLPGA